MKLRLLGPTLLAFASCADTQAQEWLRRDVRTDAALAAVHFADEWNGYIGGLNIVLKTSDGGTTWIPTASLPTNATFLAVYAKSPSEVFVSRTGLYRSIDGGEHWEEIGDFSNFAGSIFDIRFTSASTGFFIKEGNVFQTTDGGTVWELIYAPGDHFLSEIDAPDAQTIYSTGGITYGDFGFISRADFVRSFDGGETWESVPLPQLHEIQAAAWVGPRHGFVFTFTGEVHETFNGGDSWDLVHAGLGAIALDAVFADAQKGIVVTLEGKILATSNAGRTWVEEAFSENALEALAGVGSQSFVAVGGGGTILQRLGSFEPAAKAEITGIAYLPEEGRIRLDIHSPPGRSYRVDHSPDLLDWAPLGETTPKDSQWDFFYQIEEFPAGYFRVADPGAR